MQYPVVNLGAQCVQLRYKVHEGLSRYFLQKHFIITFALPILLIDLGVVLVNWLRYYLYCSRVSKHLQHSNFLPSYGLLPPLPCPALPCVPWLEPGQPMNNYATIY